MPRKPKIPSYRLHKASGQAVVVLNGRSHYLGVYESPESKTRYEQVVAEWLACNRQPEPEQAAGSSGTGISVSELILRYYTFAQSYYPADGDTTSEVRSIREALRPVRRLYGEQPAASFGPLALKAVRQVMVDQGWCRTHVNHQVHRVRRMFRWGVSEELVLVAVYEALRSVTGLARGRCDVRESQPVEPAFWEHVEAIKPYCTRPVAAMLEVQYLAAMRSCEVRVMRTCDIDRSNLGCWLYRPGSDGGEHGRHKNSWRGQDRVIPLGPKAIAVLTPWLNDDDPTAYLFQPRLAAEEANEKRKAKGKSRRTASQLARKRVAAPSCAPGGMYSSNTYGQSVARACKKAGLRFRPYGLRHGRKMEIEGAVSTEAARVILGQRSIQSTQHYGRLDVQRAAEVMSRLG
jgi:integrase